MAWNRNPDSAKWPDLLKNHSRIVEIATFLAKNCCQDALENKLENSYQKLPISFSGLETTQPSAGIQWSLLEKIRGGDAVVSQLMLCHI